MATRDQVKIMPYTKLNEHIDHIAHNTGIVTELKATVNDLKMSLQYSQKELDEFGNKLKNSEETSRELIKNVAGLSAKCDQLSHENSMLQDHLTNMEAQSRRNNLLMDGVQEAPDETNEACKAKLLDILDGIMKVSNVRKFQIVRCHHLGFLRPNAIRPSRLYLSFSGMVTVNLFGPIGGS